MELIIFILAMVGFILWIVAELKANKFIRIVLGILTIASMAYFTYLASSVIPYYERRFYKSSIKKIEEHLQNDEILIIKKAIAKYYKIREETGNSYKASMGLWEALNEEKDKK